MSGSFAKVKPSDIKLPCLLIGITGKANAGKDTFYNYLSEYLRKRRFDMYSNGAAEQAAEYYIVRESFASPIKKAYSSMFEIDIASLDNAAFKEQVNPFTNTTHRKELQLMGTEHFRTRTGNPDLWVQLLATRVNQLLEEEYETTGSMPTFIITDCRFDNEAEFIRANGVIVRIDREDKNPTIDNASHASEAGISYTPDYVIKNTGTLEEYLAELDDFFDNSFDRLLELHRSKKLSEYFER